MTSFYTIAKLFAQLPPSPLKHQKVFIYTGNGLTNILSPGLMDLGANKNAAAYIIETAAYSYGKVGKGEKGLWYWADERLENGWTIPGTSGDGHANHFWELANHKEQGPWNQTFVTGKGYKNFDSRFDKKVVSWEKILAQIRAAQA